MMRNVIAVLFGLTLACGAAMAAGKSFSELDKDDSGALNRAEAAAAQVEFAKADADGNGKVSKAEYKSVAPKGGSE